MVFDIMVHILQPRAVAQAPLFTLPAALSRKLARGKATRDDEATRDAAPSRLASASARAGAKDPDGTREGPVPQRTVPPTASEALTLDLDADGTCAFAGIQVRSAGAKGRGAFALGGFPAGTLVGDYIGEVIDDAELARRYTTRDPAWEAARLARGATATGDYVLAYGEGLYVDAEDPAHSNWCRYINHARDANLDLKTLPKGVGGRPRAWFVTNRDIAAGEELSFDYGDTYTWGGGEVVQ
jgi:hypothetical protein